MPPATDRPGRFDFFFYGTLCDADVREVVFGRKVEAAPATLADYEAVPVEHGRWPILLFQRGRSASGVLCRSLSLADSARLGYYEHEGRDYTAQRLAVSDGAGAAHQALVFVPTGMLRRGPGRWDLAEWQRFAKRDFLDRVTRTMRAVEAKELAPFLELWRERSA